MTMRQFNDPDNGSPSTMGTQLQTFYFQKKALIELVKEQYFGQLADVTSMPKNMGKKIKRYHYLPLLDDANLNDQGIDAAGVTITGTQYYVQFPALTFLATNATKAAKVAAVNDNINDGGVAEVIASAGADDSGGAGFATITLTKLSVKYATSVKAGVVTAYNIGAHSYQGSGNLYGSSKDVGTIAGKLPTLSENGGRVNRVGFKRVELEGTFEKFGFFDEYTQESLDFDSDAMLEEHVNREMIRGAGEMTEDALQIDLLSAAGIVRYAGAAVSKATMDETCIVSYSDLMHMSIDQDNNRTPKSTKVITGSRMVDTKTLPGARIAYIGSELLPTFERMVDLHSERAWIPIQKYADAGNVVRGEQGAAGPYRFVVVPEMMSWTGAGATADDATILSTNGKYNVYPILTVGDESFTTIGFQTDGKTVKFKVTHKKPGEATADRTDPYGESGFMSIKWYYGFMALRPERIGLIYTVAKL
jgi:N4-gp56 family major capsid protein